MVRKILIHLGDILGVCFSFPVNVCLVSELDYLAVSCSVSFVKTALKQCEWESGCKVRAVFMVGSQKARCFTVFFADGIACRVAGNPRIAE